MEDLELVRFSEINVRDTFFNSLKECYLEFEEWFKRKSSEGQEAYVHIENGHILCFIYLKEEIEPLTMDDRTLPSIRRLKVGTFKIGRKGTNQGVLLMNMILDSAKRGNYVEIYLTMFNDTAELRYLQHFFEKFGFKNIGTKSNKNGRKEIVLLRNMSYLD